MVFSVGFRRFEKWFGGIWKVFSCRRTTLWWKINLRSRHNLGASLNYGNFLSGSKPTEHLIGLKGRISRIKCFKTIRRVFGRLMRAKLLRDGIRVEGLCGVCGSDERRAGRLGGVREIKISWQLQMNFNHLPKNNGGVGVTELADSVELINLNFHKCLPSWNKLRGAWVSGSRGWVSGHVRQRFWNGETKKLKVIWQKARDQSRRWLFG